MIFVGIFFSLWNKPTWAPDPKWCSWKIKSENTKSCLSVAMCSLMWTQFFLAQTILVLKHFGFPRMRHNLSWHFLNRQTPTTHVFFSKLQPNSHHRCFCLIWTRMKLSTCSTRLLYWLKELTRFNMWTSCYITWIAKDMSHKYHPGIMLYNINRTQNITT